MSLFASLVSSLVGISGIALFASMENKRSGKTAKIEKEKKS
jgi:hypothetical protein